MLNSAMPDQSSDSISSSRTSVLAAAARHAEEYLRNVNERPVAPLPQAVAGLRELQGPLPSEPTSPESVVELLARFGSPATIANSGGGFFWFVHGGGVAGGGAGGWVVGTGGQETPPRGETPG